MTRNRHATAFLLFGLMLAGTLGACSGTPAAHSSRSGLPFTVGDVTVHTCQEDQLDRTQLDVSGSILNHSTVPSDYSFVVDSFNDGLPAGGVGITQSAVPAGAVSSWASHFSIPGTLGGTFTCRVRSLYRTTTPSP